MMMVGCEGGGEEGEAGEEDVVVVLFWCEMDDSAWRTQRTRNYYG